MNKRRPTILTFMLPEQRDVSYFWDMLDSGRTVREFTERQERIWIVVSQRIPELISLLEQLNLPAPPPDPEPET